MAEIRIGTSAFAAAGWAGSFYPKWMKSTEYLSFYATPALSTVKNWYAKTPPGFLFAAKVPQICSGVGYVAQSAAGPLSPALDVI